MLLLLAGVRWGRILRGTRCRNAWQLTSVTCIRNKSFSIYLHLLTWILNRDTLVNLEMCFSCLIYMCASLTYIMCSDVAFFLLDGKLSCKVTVMVTTLVAVAVTRSCASLCWARSLGVALGWGTAQMLSSAVAMVQFCAANTAPS